MLIQYERSTLSDKTLEIVQLANGLVKEFQRDEIQLTLRALYYRFVALHPLVLDPTGESPNTQANYKRLGAIMNKARLMGHTSWLALEDITRNLEKLAHWNSPAEILEAVRSQYRKDLWAGQPVRFEMWIEKDAGVGTIKGVCEANDVPYFSCRGNCSQSEMWAAGRRIKKRYEEEGLETIIGYGGDHDPKGVDMTRDVQRRLSMFAERDVEVRRLFLNMDQIELYDPPPNPTKEGDSTAAKYREEFGDNAWELDALDPRVIRDLIQGAIDDIVDRPTWDATREAMEEEKQKLADMIDSFREPDEDDDDEFDDE